MHKISNFEDRPPSTPRWVKVSAIIAIILILIVFIIIFVGGGDHGPGRHISGVDPADKIEQAAPGENTLTEGGR